VLVAGTRHDRHHPAPGRHHVHPGEDLPWPQLADRPARTALGFGLDQAVAATTRLSVGHPADEQESSQRRVLARLLLGQTHGLGRPASHDQLADGAAREREERVHVDLDTVRPPDGLDVVEDLSHPRPLDPADGDLPAPVVPAGQDRLVHRLLGPDHSPQASPQVAGRQVRELAPHLAPFCEVAVEPLGVVLEHGRAGDPLLGPFEPGDLCAHLAGQTAVGYGRTLGAGPVPGARARQERDQAGDRGGVASP
jgi:hypothetical protein